MKKEFWTVDQPLKGLEKEIAAYFTDQAGFLSQQLKDNRLKVVLIPAPESRHYGHKIRVVESRNMEWYREMYVKYRHFRRDRSLKSLQRISRKQDYPASFSSYDSRYRLFILKRLTEGFMCEGYFVEGEKEVIDYLIQAVLL